MKLDLIGVRCARALLVVCLTTACNSEERTIRRNQQAFVAERCPGLSDYHACLQQLEDRRVASKQAAASASAKARADATALLQNEIAGEWRSYDARSKKTKQELMATIDRALGIAGRAGEPDYAQLREEVRSEARMRMAPMIQPETRTEGDAHDVLLPSTDTARCLVWGSMWVGDADTFDGMTTLGFRRISCPSKQWHLDELARECFLYWNASAEHQPDDAIFVWKSEELFHRAQVEGLKTGDEAAMRFLALVSAGASTMMPDTHFKRIRAGQDWVEIEQVGGGSVRGFVEREACHRRARKGGR